MAGQLLTLFPLGLLLFRFVLCDEIIHDTGRAAENTLTPTSIMEEQISADSANDTSQSDADVSEEEQEEEYMPHCQRDGGRDPPDSLTGLYHAYLLHEMDVLHYKDWRANHWNLGSGAFADVHLGRMASSGECVAIKQHYDSSLSSIEREIRIHKYLEQFLPNIPLLLGLLPSGASMENASLVYQYVANSQTFYDWKAEGKSGVPVTRLQWLSIALQLAETVDVLHRKCVLHNDLHSSNILITLGKEENSAATKKSRRIFDSSGLPGDLKRQEDDAAATKKSSRIKDSAGLLGDCGNSRWDKMDHDYEEDEDKVEDEGWLHRLLAQNGDGILPRVTLIDLGHATYRRGKYLWFNNSPRSNFYRQVAPEVFRGRLTTEYSDVYSVGHQLDAIAKILNCSSLGEIATRCMHEIPSHRPPVGYIVERVKKLFLEAWNQHALMSSHLGIDKGDPASVNLPCQFPLFRHIEECNRQLLQLQSQYQTFPENNRREFSLNRKYTIDTHFNEDDSRCDTETKYIDTTCGPCQRQYLREAVLDCSPSKLEAGMLQLQIPYLASTEIRPVSQLSGGRNGTEDDKEPESKLEELFWLSDSRWGSIARVELVSTGQKVVVKQLNHESFTAVRYEALVNLYVNSTGWVPRFHGVVPTPWNVGTEPEQTADNRWRYLGIVQDYFAEGVSLSTVLQSGKPVGFAGRLALAERLASLLADVHSRYIIINNFYAQNILASCQNDSYCADIRVIDLGASCPCDGNIIPGEQSYLSRFSYLAPEVRHKRLTSYSSDVYSLYVMLKRVLNFEILLNYATTGALQERIRVSEFIVKWNMTAKACLSDDPSLRPSAAQLRDFFRSF